MHVSCHICAQLPIYQQIALLQSLITEATNNTAAATYMQFKLYVRILHQESMPRQQHVLHPDDGHLDVGLLTMLCMCPHKPLHLQSHVAASSSCNTSLRSNLEAPVMRWYQGSIVNKVCSGLGKTYLYQCHVPLSN
jgi:hypothetical protein